MRRAADRHIDAAHSAIAGAEMLVSHATEATIAYALAELAVAQSYLTRAIAARDAWDSVPHDEYESYPDIARLPESNT